jgi:hypothetical protein
MMSHGATRAPRARAQLRRSAVVVYATLGINALCIPTSVSDWAEQLGSERARALLMPVANCLVSISNLTVADRPYLTARELFLSMTNKKEPDDVIDR